MFNRACWQASAYVLDSEWKRYHLSPGKGSTPVFCTNKDAWDLAVHVVRLGTRYSSYNHTPTRCATVPCLKCKLEWLAGEEVLSTLRVEQIEFPGIFELSQWEN